jgi:glycosyltransferase involved in cell wall biosynthesis
VAGHPADPAARRRDRTLSEPVRAGVAVVLPVRGLDGLLRGCLMALGGQLRAPEEVVIVDDSPDGSLDVAAVSATAPSLAVRVLRSGGVGPYAARNLGWQSTAAEILLFLDARSRPRPAWVGALASAFDDPAVALTGSEVVVLGGPTLGERAAHRQQFFRLRNYLEAPDFRPYLPTCNLGIRRADLEAVGGFREIRSGGDADVCWRVLGRPGRQLVPVTDVLMDWVPRDSARDYLEQNYRYGRSSLALRREWASAGAQIWPPLAAHVLGRRAAMLGVRFAVASARRDSDARVDLMSRAGQWALDLGYLRAHHADGVTRQAPAGPHSAPAVP